MGAGGGLQLRVYPTGRKTWGLRRTVGGSVETVTLGQWPRMSLAAAREKAGDLREAAEESDENLRWAMHRWREGRKALHAAPPFREFAARYMAEVAREDRKDLKPLQRILDRDLLPTLGSIPMDKLRPDDVQKLVFARRDAGRRASAAAMRGLLKRICGYAKVCQMIEKNPVDATPQRFVYRPRARTRTLSVTELRRFFAGLEELRTHPGERAYAAALDLLLLTLVRKNTLRMTRWEHMDFETGIWEIPAELMKMGLPLNVYLSRQAVARFEELRKLAGPAEVVLPGRWAITVPIEQNVLNKVLARHWKAWKLQRFSPHDLRRTASTRLNEMGYDPDWVEVALGHSIKGIRGVYNRAQYAEQRRQMLQEWADYLDTLRKGA